MQDFPRYEKYKGSGVEWLGTVPEHWDISPLKSLFQMSLEKNGKNIIGEMLSAHKDLERKLASLENKYDQIMG